MRKIILFVAAFISFNYSNVNAQKSRTSKYKEKVCHATSFSMNEIYKEWDGQWQGIAVASDGNCYFATSTHSRGHGAGFHKYDPKTKRHTLIAKDMTLVCGEGDIPSQQGKIHSPIVEYDGWLYFATHLSNYWPEGIDVYPGAHVLGYELATGKFRDFGIIKKRYSIYSAVNVDPERKKLYVFVSPFQKDLIKNDGAHLYSVDIVSGEKKDLGQLTQGELGANFWFFIDNRGNCWFTLWKMLENTKPSGRDRGNLYCYSPEAGKIITYEDVLPKGEYMDGTPVTDEHLLGSRAWTWAAALPGREQCLFTMGMLGGGDERLWIFDPSRNIEKGKAFKPIAYIGSTFLETALGGDRVYFVQYDDLEIQRTQVAEFNRDKDPDVEGYDDYLHLRSVSIAPGSDYSITDHGAIIDQEGRTPRMINSLAADDQGRVYMMGSWYINHFRNATLQVLFYDHPGERLYKLEKRGEFFAVVETE